MRASELDPWNGRPRGGSGPRATREGFPDGPHRPGTERGAHRAVTTSTAPLRPWATPLEPHATGRHDPDGFFDDSGSGGRHGMALRPPARRAATDPLAPARDRVQGGAADCPERSVSPSADEQAHPARG